ncbi:hypothetical protein AWC05_09470 [Mycobacterium florentinum]|uniref:Uncharacterized protein n=1 Tax=Mycobacterium florentinum TaxID=292462 RepID=A0A1X1UKX1_MYCFL|nr:MmpS family transport accessory protein [Mycobacterium florentinum]MCV7411360.1 hypothetical protein [Mycobacterium florentinum]ORV57476.1 hypothetical protein AWC05_09470 [Mycobacterium florentinum]
MAATLSVGASLLTSPGAGAAVGDTVAYTVTSDDPLLRVVYDDPTTGQQVILTNPTAPWSFTFTVKNASQMLSVTASTKGKPASCQLSVNGTVKDTQTGKLDTDGVTLVQCYSMS